MLPVFLLGLAGVLMLPGLLTGPSLDAAVFVHVAGRMLDGATLYVDAWDHKPPGIYLAVAGASSLLPFVETWVAAWLLSVASIAATGWLVGRALRVAGVDRLPATIAAAGAVVASAQYLLSLGGGLSETLAVLPVAAVLRLLAEDAIPTPRRVLSIGVMLAVACLVSLQLVPAAAVLGVLAVVKSSGDQNTSPRVAERARSVVWLIVGGVLPVAATVAWLAAIGTLPAAVDAIVDYGAAYAAANEGYGGTLSGPVIAWSLLALVGLVVPAAIGALGTGRRAITWTCLAWVGLTLVLFPVQGRFLAHYAIPLCVPLGVLAGIGLERTAERLAGAAGGVRVALAAPLVMALVVSAGAGVAAGAMELGSVANSNARTRAVAARIHDRLPSGGGTLLVWGNQPRLYELTGMDAATPYGYLFPLTTPGYSTLDQVEALRHAFGTHPPTIVIDAGSDAPGEPGFLPLLHPRPVLTDGRDLDNLDTLRTFVARQYTLLDTVAGWPIYIRSDLIILLEAPVP